ncbi:hypothetical protein BKA66DRAFT_455027 [Pyrenochaeta sp. MPI-SDFR-AT-0127]|nr:hypothetical protein BKA66DRAFT_455027 [Pyrenochaeta sp. MPI-SDFR-AT-0127]
MGHLGVVHSIALASGSFLSGAMMSLSIITMPVLVNTPLSTAQLCSVWSQIYVRGRGLLPALAIVTCAMYGYVYTRQKSPRPSKALLLAGGITIAIAPFTWIALAPTNNQLFALHSENRAMTAFSVGAEPAKELIVEWSYLHLVRSTLPLFGAAIGLLYGSSR